MGGEDTLFIADALSKNVMYGMSDDDYHPGSGRGLQVGVSYSKDEKDSALSKLFEQENADMKVMMAVMDACPELREACPNGPPQDPEELQ